MAHFEGTIIIVDPVYVTNTTDWNDYFKKRMAPRRLFKTWLIEDTVWGDGDWNFKSGKDTKKVTTTGLIGVFYENDILTYNPDFYKNIKGNYVKLDNFSGDIKTKFDEDRATRVWKGTGNVNFIIEN